MAVGAAAVFAATFDPNRYKPQIEAAVKRATGRDLALNGPITLGWGFSPSFEARDVALANVAGGSRPEMVTLGRLQARISLLGLLHRRLDIERLVLIRPDILLEKTPGGEANWRFSPAVPSQPLPQPAPANASHAPPPEITLRDLRIEDGTVTYRAAGGQDRVLTVRRFEAKAASPDAPTEIATQAAYDGHEFTLDGAVGPLAALQAPNPVAPWPVRLTLGVGGANATVAGSLRQPLNGRGYDLLIDGSVPDLKALQPFYPRATLPGLRGVTASAHVADAGDGRPGVSAVTLHAGPSDLSALAPGLTLDALDVNAPALDQPATLAAKGTLSGQPLDAKATMGAPSALLGPASAPFPVDAAATLGAARLTAKGTIAQPAKLTGADLAVQAQIPDLAALSPLARRPLPSLKDAAFRARLSDAPGGFAHGIVLKGMALTTAQADLTGDLTLGTDPRPFARGTVASGKIDLDGIAAALAAGRPAAPSPAAAPIPPAPPTPPPGSPPAASHPGRNWVIPDTQLPFGPLLQADADLGFTVGTLIARGATYRDVSGHLVLDAGKLRLDPFAMQLPGGPMRLTLSADAGQPKPPVAATLHAPGLALKALLAALRLPQEASGTVEVDLDLKGAGRTPHEIASGVNGHLGLASTGAKIGNRVLADTLGTVLADAKLPGVGDVQGVSDVRCFAARLEAANGRAAVRGLLLDTTLVHVEGTGSVNLADETLALQLRPLVRIGGTGVVVPLRVGGTLRAPKAAVDASGAAGEAARQAGAAGVKSNSALGIVIGALGGDRMIAGSGARDSCAPELALARTGKASAVPAAAAAAPAPPAQGKLKAPKPADLLRQLFR